MKLSLHSRARRTGFVPVSLLFVLLAFAELLLVAVPCAVALMGGSLTSVATIAAGLAPFTCFLLICWKLTELTVNALRVLVEGRGGKDDPPSPPADAPLDKERPSTRNIDMERVRFAARNLRPLGGVPVARCEETEPQIDGAYFLG